jgi:hypothetical protein
MPTFTRSAGIEMHLFPDTTSPHLSHDAQLEVYQRFEPAWEDQAPPISDSSTPSSTLGGLFNGQDISLLSHKAASVEFEQDEINDIVITYKTLKEGIREKEVDLYKRRLRDINACLKCFTTEWRVPGGPNDPVMKLLFTR